MVDRFREYEYCGLCGGYHGWMAFCRLNKETGRYEVVGDDDEEADDE